MATTTHTMRNGFCVTCGETEEWLSAHDEAMVPVPTAAPVSRGDRVRLAGGRLTHVIDGPAVSGIGRTFTATYCGRSFQAGDHAHDETKPLCKVCAKYA